MATILGKLRRRPERRPGEEYDEMARRASAERHQLERSLASAAKSREQMEQLGHSVAQLKTQLSGYETRRDELESRFDASAPTADLLDSLRVRTEAVESTTDEFEQRLRRIAHQIVETENSSDEIAHLLDASREIEAKLASASVQAKTISSVETKIGALTSQIAHFETKCDGVAARFSGLDGSAENLSGKLQTMQGSGDVLTHELERTKRMAEGIDDALTGLECAKVLSQTTHQDLMTLSNLSDEVSKKLDELDRTKQALEVAETRAIQVNDVASRIEERVKRLKSEEQTLDADRNLHSMRLGVAELNEHFSHAYQRKDQLFEQSAVIEKRLGDSSTRLGEQLECVRALKDEVSLANDQFTALDERLSNYKEQLHELTRSQVTLDEARHKTEAAIDRMESIHRRIGVIESKTKQLTSVEQRLAELATLALRVNQDIDSINSRKDLVDSTKDRILDLEELYEEVQRRFRHLRKGQEDLTSTLALVGDFQRRAAETTQTITELQDGFAEVDALNGRLQEVEGLASSVEQRARELEPQLGGLRGMDSRLRELTALSRDIDTRGVEVRRHQEEQDERLREMERLFLDLERRRRKLTDAEERFASLELRIERAERSLDPTGHGSDPVGMARAGAERTLTRAASSVDLDPADRSLQAQPQGSADPDMDALIHRVDGFQARIRLPETGPTMEVSRPSSSKLTREELLAAQIAETIRPVAPVAATHPGRGAAPEVARVMGPLVPKPALPDAPKS